jgi:hypothetical protein
MSNLARFGMSAIAGAAPSRRKPTLNARGLRGDEPYRPRQFTKFALSPQSVVEAFRGVYTSLLARDT